ncbi:MAG: 2Fe-2S iron-sulfur cluster-binding protein [Aliidongia sp.]
MVDIHVQERDGTERVVSTRPGGNLMEALRDADTGVEGICGGNCSCGTCHVYVDEAWAGRLAPPSIDETTCSTRSATWSSGGRLRGSAARSR